MKTKTLLILTPNLNNMKKTLLLFAVLLGFISVNAQNNPFAELGYEPKIATLSNGKYNESFDNDTIVQIGSVLFNTKSQQIVAFVVTDTMYSEATLVPDIVSRWLSPDPLANEYTSWSPYNFVKNSPIRFIDPDGRKVFVYGQDAEATVAAIQKTTTLQLTYNTKTKQIEVMGTPETDYDKALVSAINDVNVEVNLITTRQTTVSVDGNDVGVDVGGFGGNREFTDSDGNTVVKTQQFFNIEQANEESEDGGNSTGTNAAHEVIESYIAGKESPNAKTPVYENATKENVDAYLNAHQKASDKDPKFKERIKTNKNGKTTTEYKKVDYGTNKKE